MKKEGGGNLERLRNTCGSFSRNVNIKALKAKGRYSPVTCLNDGGSRGAAEQTRRCVCAGAQVCKYDRDTTFLKHQ